MNFRRWPLFIVDLHYRLRTSTLTCTHKNDKRKRNPKQQQQQHKNVNDFSDSVCNGVVIVVVAVVRYRMAYLTDAVVACRYYTLLFVAYFFLFCLGYCFKGNK